MREAVIVSTARTPLTKAQRGEFNLIAGPTLAAHAVRAAVERSGIDPALIEDAIVGCGYPEGATGRNIGRQAVIRTGLPASVGGATVNRYCASGLQAIALAAARIVMDGAPAMIAGGVECVSQIRSRDDASDLDPWIVANKPALYLPMIETADIVAARYGISREAQDRFAAQSQARNRSRPGRRSLPRGNHCRHHDHGGHRPRHRLSLAARGHVGAGHLQPARHHL